MKKIPLKSLTARGNISPENFNILKNEIGNTIKVAMNLSETEGDEQLFQTLDILSRSFYYNVNTFSTTTINLTRRHLPKQNIRNKNNNMIIFKSPLNTSAQLHIEIDGEFRGATVTTSDTEISFQKDKIYVGVFNNTKKTWTCEIISELPPIQFKNFLGNVLTVDKKIYNINTEKYITLGIANRLLNINPGCNIDKYFNNTDLFGVSVNQKGLYEITINITVEKIKDVDLSGEILLLNNNRTNLNYDIEKDNLLMTMKIFNTDLKKQKLHNTTITRLNTTDNIYLAAKGDFRLSMINANDFSVSVRKIM